MPVSDFMLYEQYYRKQPFGQWRSDYNAAMIAQSMTGAKMQDYMGFWYDQEPDESAFESLFEGAVKI